jgi:hypothetical protein
MEESGRDVIRNVPSNPSWFRDTPHYWAEASLPFAYALACVEVVSKSSEKAGVIYNRIVEAWIAPEGADIKGYLKPDVINADSRVLTTGRTSGCVPFHTYVNMSS